MKRNARNAFNALKKAGFSVWEDRRWSEGAHFEISGEEGLLDYWNDYWGDEIGINPILKKYGLYFEWINAGVAGVYDA